MKIICVALYIVALCACVAGFMGHSPAWVAAALSFFAATMVIIQQKNK